MCFLKSCLSPAFRGLQITLHPSPRCTPQPSNLPSSTSYPAGSSAIVGPGFASQNSTAQHFASQSNPRDLLHQSLDTERFSSTIQHPKAHTASPKQQGGRQSSRAPALPTKALCMVVGEQFSTSLWLLPLSPWVLPPFPCPSPAGRSEFSKGSLPHHCIPGCWVGVWELIPEARGTAWLGTQLGVR